MACNHPCRCHAINPNHTCGAPRTSIVMTWYEEDAVRDVLRDCGFDAMLEVVNRLLMSTASHQYAAGIKTGEFLERARIETDMLAVLNPKRSSNE